jgi:hypothetical protein
MVDYNVLSFLPVPLLRGTHTPSFAHSAPMRATDFLCIFSTAFRTALAVCLWLQQGTVKNLTFEGAGSGPL